MLSCQLGATLDKVLLRAREAALTLRRRSLGGDASVKKQSDRLAVRTNIQIIEEQAPGLMHF